MKLAAVSAAILSLLTSATALAQTPPSAEPETLTAGGSSGGTKISGWFLAPTFGTTGFDGRLNYTPGLRGGIYLNKRFAVGLAAQGLASSATTLNANEVRNLGSYGGLLLQYIWRSDQLIHGTLESTIGNGRWCAVGTGGSDSCAAKEFLVFEPAANLELNVAKHVRFASGVGYRFAVAGSGEGPSSRDMSSLVVRTSLIFGSF
jgi:opacity protein-like surface antigen